MEPEEGSPEVLRAERDSVGGLLTETWPTTESRRTASANEIDLRLYLRVESELLRSLLRTTVPSDGGLTGLRGPERTPGEVAISLTDQPQLLRSRTFHLHLETLLLDSSSYTPKLCNFRGSTFRDR